MSIKAGIEQSGQKEIDEFLKELHQLHSWNALFPKKKQQLSNTGRKKAPQYLTRTDGTYDMALLRQSMAACVMRKVRIQMLQIDAQY